MTTVLRDGMPEGVRRYVARALPAPRAGRGPLWRWVRQAEVAAPRTWRPWWLLGLVEVVSYPRPHWRSRRALFVPGVRASCGLPARAAFLVAR